ncbi:hypothetical protein CGLO_03907 [Colletotrichum gloeosporioides Cg-14]|uniref:Uncharacterized protein n=1 Tax=Colletotrichum gloeosporioides (strain Cg-14) TaxID=1237896 RepID=T0KTT1_COLGC|nr:hypothetical protein CGLO_03907 [Colletotrichum gloeosporioides Cg-14]
MTVHHVSLAAGRSSFQAMRSFYIKALAPLGYAVSYEDSNLVGFTGSDGVSDFGIHAITEVSPGSNEASSRTHIAFQGNSAEMINKWYQAAMLAVYATENLENARIMEKDIMLHSFSTL